MHVCYCDFNNAITQRSVPHVETINNADVIKLLRCDRTLELYYFYFIIIYFLFLFNLIEFNSRTRKKIARRQNENGGENQSVRGGVRTRNLPIMCRALYPLRHGDTADTGRLARFNKI